MFKFFSKKAGAEPASQFNTKGFATRAVIWFHLFFCLALLIILAISFGEYQAKVTQTSIDSSQAVMINVVTGEVVKGSLYKDPTAPTEDLEEVIASNTELPHAQRYRTKPLDTSPAILVPLSYKDNTDK